jgi:hypothetical protein
VVIPLDAVKRVPEMIDFAQSIPLDNIVAWMKAQWI